MALQSHTFRRGASYVWRKRIPVKAGGGMLQISLRTNDPLIAKRLALIVGAESCRIFDAMEHKGLTRDEARRLLVAVIDREHDKIRARRTFVAEDPTPDALRRHILDDRAAAYALKALADKGLGAAEFGPAEAEPLRAKGFDDQAIMQVVAMIEGMLPAFSEDPRTGSNSPAFKLMREVLGRDDFDALAMLEGRKIYLQGRAAALESAANAEEDQADEPDLMELADQIRKGQSVTVQPVAPRLASASSPQLQAQQDPTRVEPLAEPRPASFIEKEDSYSPAMSAVVKRLMTQKKRQGMSEQMIGQMTKFYDLFIEASTVTDIRNLRQSHLARFVDLLHELPSTYRKSPKDRAKSLQTIIKEAGKDTPRLSITTINRNLDYLGQLITKAKSEGFANVAMLDVNALRPRKNKRDRDERPAFTAEDVQKLFTHPLWTGNMRKNKWQIAGPHLTKDGVYWVPLIAALSGARREEIAALKAADIEEIDGIAVMHIRENANRGLKNFSSERIIPLHPQLIELGLMDHAARMATQGKEADLFPDLKKGGKFGQTIDYKFRMITEAQLNGNPEGKVFHSFRHYVTTTLGQIDSIREQTRKDILGHVGSSITEERYSATTPLPAKFEAIAKLPRLPVA